MEKNNNEEIAESPDDIHDTAGTTVADDNVSIDSEDDSEVTAATDKTGQSPEDWLM